MLFENSDRDTFADGQSQPGPLRHARSVRQFLLELGSKVVGGRYWHTRVEVKFSQCGDGRIMGSDECDRDHFAAVPRCYDWKSSACRSPASVVIDAGRIRASRRRIVGLKPRDGVFVRRYHLTPEPRCDSPAEIEPFPIDNAAIGLFRVIGSPWRIESSLAVWTWR